MSFQNRQKIHVYTPDIRFDATLFLSKYNVIAALNSTMSTLVGECWRRRRQSSSVTLPYLILISKFLNAIASYKMLLSWPATFRHSSLVSSCSGSIFTGLPSKDTGLEYWNVGSWTLSNFLSYAQNFLSGSTDKLCLIYVGNCSNFCLKR